MQTHTTRPPGFIVWTSCAEKARKLQTISGVEVSLEVAKGTNRYWYPRWAARFFALLETAGMRKSGDKVYKLIGIAREHREIVNAVDTMMRTGGAVAVHALAAELLTLYKE